MPRFEVLLAYSSTRPWCASNRSRSLFVESPNPGLHAPGPRLSQSQYFACRSTARRLRVPRALTATSTSKSASSTLPPGQRACGRASIQMLSACKTTGAGADAFSRCLSALIMFGNISTCMQKRWKRSPSRIAAFLKSNKFSDCCHVVQSKYLWPGRGVGSGAGAIFIIESRCSRETQSVHLWVVAAVGAVHASP